jgi:hypothetical protein
MNIRSIAQALGGDVAGRDSVLAPGPGHSSGDRSLLVSFKGGEDFIVHSFANDDWKLCRDEVKARLGLAEWKPGTARPRTAPTPVINADQADHAAQQLEKARLLWRRSTPIAGTVAETYLRDARGYDGPLPSTLRFLRGGGEYPPAMIAAFGIPAEPEPGVLSIAEDEIRGVHVTRLKPDGSAKAGTQRDKFMLGPSSGWPIVLAPANDLLAISVTEGIEDGLISFLASGRGVWVAGAAGRMPSLVDRIPQYTESVTIFAHDDIAGQRGAKALAAALSHRDNLEIFIEGITV